MRDGNLDGQSRIERAAGQRELGALFRSGALEWASRVWRPAGTVVAVALALLLTWHVVNGKHGLSVWQQKRVEDKQLRKEIEELEQENARLRIALSSSSPIPHAIEREAREKLHYAKPGEVIYALPPEPKSQAQPAAK